MPTQEPQSGSDVKSAADNVARAHKLLKALEEKLGQHPEVGQAVNMLERALAILDVQTGGML
jgi:hypothetical protein